MLKLAIFSCLLVVCLTQPPPEPQRPDIAETFQSMSDDFYKRGDKEVRGQGKWDRSEELTSFLDVTMYKSMNGTSEEFEHLGLFASHKEYNIFTGPDGTKKCEPHDIPAQAEFPKVWDWIMQAEYHEFTDHRTNKTYDAWEAHMEDMSRVVLVTKDDPNTPVALMTRSREGEHDRRFLSFSLEPPPQSTFMVPTECMPPPPQANHEKHH